jgi:hypothetical protein
MDVDDVELLAARRLPPLPDAGLVVRQVAPLLWVPPDAAAVGQAELALVRRLAVPVDGMRGA